MNLAGTSLNPLEERKRHPITTGADVVDGVLLTRAGIVPDLAENPRLYETILADVDMRLASEGAKSTPVILEAVHTEASRLIPLSDDSEEAYARLLKSEAEARGLSRLTACHQIALSRFVSLEVGICHQHTLLSATILSMMRERGDIDGGISIESDPDEVDPDRHTWVVFSGGGEDFSLDALSGVRSSGYPRSVC